VQPEVQSGFQSFSLHTRILDAVDGLGFTEPRPIQAETIPACLEGRDVMGLAQTGTGKTAAFVLPILQKNLNRKGRATRALILAPTRELANQIATEARELARYTKLSVVAIYGGVPISKHVRSLKKQPDIVVGCPGRVLDLLGRGALDVSEVETLVLDEADHMFDMGFLPDLKRIVARLPEQRQNLLFSATMPKEIRRLASEMLEAPYVAELAPTAPAERIEHFLYPIPEKAKGLLLDEVLASGDCNTAIVFMRTKFRAKKTAERLAKRGRSAVALQGNMSQGQRDRAMAGFREGRFEVLVATDIAARGLDVAGVDYVVNFDVPNTPEAYTHRIGRTGRAEASGKACTFVTPEDRAWVRSTEKILGSRIPVRRAPDGVPSSGCDPHENADPAARGPRRRRRARATDSPRDEGGRSASSAEKTSNRKRKAAKAKGDRPTSGRRRNRAGKKRARVAK